LAGIGERGDRLGEDHRIGGRLPLVAGLVDAAAGGLPGGGVVVLADAPYLLGERPPPRPGPDVGHRRRHDATQRGPPAAGGARNEVAEGVDGRAFDEHRTKAALREEAENLALSRMNCCDLHTRYIPCPTRPEPGGRAPAFTV